MTKVYYAQNQFANESFPIIDSNYKPVTDYYVAESIFLANFCQSTYVLTSN